MKIVRWTEPDEDGNPIQISCSIEEAIRQQKEVALKVGYQYHSDEQALEDFIANNWAFTEEVQ